MCVCVFPSRGRVVLLRWDRSFRMNSFESKAAPTAKSIAVIQIPWRDFQWIQNRQNMIRYDLQMRTVRKRCVLNHGNRRRTPPKHTLTRSAFVQSVLITCTHISYACVVLVRVMCARKIGVDRGEERGGVGKESVNCRCAPCVHMCLTHGYVTFMCCMLSVVLCCA